MNFLRKLGFFERRASKRIDPVPPLKGICSCKELGQEGFLVYVTQASQSGALISVNKQKFGVGIFVELRIAISGRSEELLLRGKVLRSWRQGGHGWYSAVIKFSSESEGHAQMLLNYLAHRGAR
ncbi:MAG: PilZ domain-containing protein [Candidatus Omnitrophota bacterium]